MCQTSFSSPIGFDGRPEVDGEFVPDKLFRPIGFDDKYEVDGRFVPDKTKLPQRSPVAASANYPRGRLHLQ